MAGIEANIECENGYGVRYSLSEWGTGLWGQSAVAGLRASAEINASTIAGIPGATLVSTRAPERMVSIPLTLENWEAKQKLYNLFRPEEAITLYYTENGQTWKAEGITEKINDFAVNQFPVDVVIDLYFPNAFFVTENPVKDYISRIVPNWEFPMELPWNPTFVLSYVTPSLIADLINKGQVETGVLFRIHANGNVENPKITDINTYQEMWVEVSMKAGDEITIQTEMPPQVLLKLAGEKPLDYINYWNGDFLTLRPYPAKNELRYSADAGERNMEITVEYYPKYRGV